AIPATPDSMSLPDYGESEAGAGTVSARCVARLIEWAALQPDASAALRAGLGGAALDEPDGRIPSETAYCAIELAAELSGDLHLALHYVDALGMAALDALGLLALASRTVGEALERYLHHSATVTDALDLELVIDGDVARLRC